MRTQNRFHAVLCFASEIVPRERTVGTAGWRAPVSERALHPEQCSPTRGIGSSAKLPSK